MRTVESLYRSAVNILHRSHTEEPVPSAEFLLAAMLKIGRSNLPFHFDRSVSTPLAKKYMSRIHRRARRWPVAYLLQSQPFMGLDFKVSPDVLIPRPETEFMLEKVLEVFKVRGEEPGMILELGTGSGCIAVSLARAWPTCTVVATDISSPALKVARQNALRHGVSSRIQFFNGDLFESITCHLPLATCHFDLIISNPPYIPHSRRLAPEVLKEPRLAWDGGKSGRVILERIIGESPAYLRSGGWLVLEIDCTQGCWIQRLMKEVGYHGIRVLKDFNDLNRVALAQRR